MGNESRVVILGCGFAGLGACNSLKGSGVHVTLIDKHDYHTFQPLLYQVATAMLDPEVVGHSIRDLFRDEENFRFIQTTIKGVDVSKKVVQLEGTDPVPYDYLVVALGANVNFFGTAGADEHAFPLYTMQDAIRLKTHLLEAFEEADKDPELEDRGTLDVVVVGGGPTGVEIAGALAELYHTDFAKDYPNLQVGQARITLVNGPTSILGAFKPNLRAYAEEALRRKGVDLQLGVHVTSVAPDSVTLDSGAVIPCRTVVWAGGLTASPLAESLGVELARHGRVPVETDLSLQAHPEVFVAGDIAAAVDKNNTTLPQLGAVALQAGHSVGKNILHRIAGQETVPFHYVDKGFMATIGRGAAVAQMPHGLTLKGRIAWVAWGAVHLVLLTGFHNRIAATMEWFWNLFRDEHVSRINLGE